MLNTKYEPSRPDSLSHSGTLNAPLKKITKNKKQKESLEVKEKMISWKDNWFFFSSSLFCWLRSEFVSPRHWLTCAEVHITPLTVSTSLCFIPSVNVSSCERFKPPFYLFISICICLFIYLFISCIVFCPLRELCDGLLRTNMDNYRIMLSRDTTHLSMLILNCLEKRKRHRQVWGTSAWLLLYFSILMWTCFFFFCFLLEHYRWAVYLL